MLNNKVNVNFNSVNGIMAKTHPKSQITWCHWESPLYKNLDKKRILQMVLISDTMMCIEYIELEYLDEIFDIYKYPLEKCCCNKD